MKLSSLEMLCEKVSRTYYDCEVSRRGSCLRIRFWDYSYSCLLRRVLDMVHDLTVNNYSEYPESFSVVPSDSEDGIGIWCAEMIVKPVPVPLWAADR